MDFFILEAVVRELRERIPGARIDKIHQPGPETLILRLWTGRETLRLLVSLDPRRPRLHLTERAAPNPLQPPRFCQLLRARLGRIEGIEQAPRDRIVRLLCRGKQGESLTLAAELLGAHGDLVLVDGEGKIIDGLRRDAAGERERLPGRDYRIPPRPSRCDLADGVPAVPPEALRPEAFSRWLLEAVEPMSPLVARDLAEGVAQGVPPGEALARFRRQWLEGQNRAIIGTLSGRRVFAALSPLYLGLEDREAFDSPSAAADSYYAEEVTATDVSGLKAQMQASVRRELKRLEKRREKIELDREGLMALDQKRHLGELLISNLYRVRRGMKEITVEDYHCDPPSPVTIPLDPRISPQENAERLFRGYKKGRRGEEHIARRLEETARQVEWLEGVLHALTEAETGDDLQELQGELEEAGLVPPQRLTPGKRRRPDPREGIRQGKSPGGFALCWGRNSRTNDFVSRELTAPDDLWFHAHGMPGAHLVLKRGSRQGEIPEEDVLYAAALAAGYSRGKDDTKVEVKVARGRDIRRPKGAPPGLVTVEHFRTVRVRPIRSESL